MEDKTMRMNQTLGVLILSAVIAAFSHPSSSAAGSDSEARNTQTIAGSWTVRGTPAPESGIPPFVNVASATKDGRLVNVDPFLGTGVGEWEKTENRRFAVTFMHLTTRNGQPIGIKVRSRFELDRDGKEFEGPFTTEIFDSNGNLTGSFTGWVQGVRFDVEPL
jgi:hypothetical protein